MPPFYVCVFVGIPGDSSLFVRVCASPLSFAPVAGNLS